MVLQPGHYHPLAQPPAHPTLGTGLCQAPPALPSRRIAAMPRNGPPCSSPAVCAWMDGWKDGQTDEGPFHMPAPEQLPAHSRADAGNSRFLLLIDAVLLRHALLQLAGSSEATAVPMLA